MSDGESILFITLNKRCHEEALIITRFRAITMLFLLTSLMCHASENDQHAVLLQYHHVSDSTPPSTSVTPERFAEHLDYIAQHFTVLPLTKIIDALKNNQPLPENSLAITFDDGYRNILENAHPMLTRHGFPYTIFVNPALTGTRKNLLTWKELKQMSNEGVLIANHYLGHEHMLYQATGKSEAQWIQDHKSNILLAEEIIKDSIGSSPGFFAYPYGEFDANIQAMLTNLELVGFAQHSGGISSNSDFTALPRFPASGVYSSLNTLKVKMRSLAFPVAQNSLSNPRLKSDGQPAPMQMTIDLTDIYPSQVACYYQGTTLAIAWNDNTMTVELPERFPTGRSRINCTAPSKQNRSHYYWYSQPFFVPTQDGDWRD